MPINVNDKELKNSLVTAGVDAAVFTQPPHSPDVNLLDLCFPHAIQSAKDDDEVSKVEGELIEDVTKL